MEKGFQVIIKTGRFGQLPVNKDDIITIPQGILGFPEIKRYCLVDPGDDVLILWLQAMEDSYISFPVLEPKVFKPDYTAHLSATELKEINLGNINQSAVFSVLTIPDDITQMSANLKAPIVLNLKEQFAKQVILQESEYSIKHLMFRELKAHLLTIQSNRQRMSQSLPPSMAKGLEEGRSSAIPVPIRNIPPSLTVKSLQA